MVKSPLEAKGFTKHKKSKFNKQKLQRFFKSLKKGIKEIQGIQDRLRIPFFFTKFENFFVNFRLFFFFV